MIPIQNIHIFVSIWRIYKTAKLLKLQVFVTYILVLGLIFCFKYLFQVLNIDLEILLDDEITITYIALKHKIISNYGNSPFYYQAAYNMWMYISLHMNDLFKIWIMVSNQNIKGESIIASL